MLFILLTQVSNLRLTNTITLTTNTILDQRLDYIQENPVKTGLIDKP